MNLNINGTKLVQITIHN